MSTKFAKYSSLSIINKIRNFDPLKFRFERERKGTQKYHKALVQMTTKKVIKLMALDEKQKTCPEYSEIIEHPKMHSCISQVKRERHESKKTKGKSIARLSKDKDLYGYASKTLRGWINEILNDLGLVSQGRPKKI